MDWQQTSAIKDLDWIFLLKHIKLRFQAILKKNLEASFHKLCRNQLQG